MTCCNVDLTSPPFNVAPDDPSAAAVNTTGINTAITTYAGTGARLILPAGDIYVDRADTTRHWSIKFAAGVSDLALVGHGMFSTRIIIQGDGGGSDWVGILLDGSSRIELADFGIQMGVVPHPDPGDQNHLIGIYCSAGVTSDIIGHHLYFGQAVGDGLRILGDAAPVTNIRFTDFVMRMSGIGLGARSGVAFQRGWKAVELGNFYIDGVKNSPIDMEPTGLNPQPMSHLNIHDGLIDQSLGHSHVAFSIGGVSHHARAQHIRVSDVTVLEGRVVVLSTDDLQIKNMTIIATAQFAEPLLLVRQINNDLRLEQLYLERQAGSQNGNVLDVQNAGDSTTIDGGVFLEGADGYPATFDGTGNLRLRGARIRYDGTSPGGRGGVNVVASVGDADSVQIDDVQVSCSTGKLRSAVTLAPRAGRSMGNLRVTNLHCAGSAANGVYFSYHPLAKADPSPLISGIDNRPDNVWKQVDHNDNPITTIFPTIAGNPGGVCEMVGQVPPEGSVNAIQGTIYTCQDGDATARYHKSAGTGNTGWSSPIVVP
jgi:hypothetical protein